MERASTRCLGWRVLCSGRARIGQCVDTSVTANAVFQIKKWRNSNREGGEWVSPARPSGLPLHRADRHTIPGLTRAFVRTAHNHAQVTASRCTGWSGGATQTMGGGGSGSGHRGAELQTAACNRPAHPTLACVCLGGAMKIDATPLIEDQTKLFVPIFRDVGILLFCQPSIDANL